MSAEKKPLEKEPPSSKRKIQTTSRSWRHKFVAGVAALALRPVLQQILRWHEWRELKAARLQRERKSKPVLERVKLKFLDMPFKVGSQVGDVPEEAVAQLDREIRALEAQTKRWQTIRRRRRDTTKRQTQPRGDRQKPAA